MISESSSSCHLVVFTNSRNIRYYYPIFNLLYLRVYLYVTICLIHICNHKHYQYTDNERIALEESRNKFEVYTYHIKNKLIDDEEIISAVSIEEQGTALLALVNGAEE